MISVVAELGIADLLKDAPHNAEYLAMATSVHEPSLYRLLRALASLGIFAERDHRVFEQTPLSATLRTDVVGSLRDLALFQNDEWYWEIYRDLPHTVRNSVSLCLRASGTGVLSDYFADHPDAARRFNAGMASPHAENNAALATGDDFSGSDARRRRRRQRCPSPQPFSPSSRECAGSCLIFLAWSPMRS